MEKEYACIYCGEIIDNYFDGHVCITCERESHEEAYSESGRIENTQE